VRQGIAGRVQGRVLGLTSKSLPEIVKAARRNAKLCA
jgi:hypothetical protein